MEVESRMAAPFRTLPDSLPSQTIICPLKSKAPPTDQPHSPTVEIPNLPKNAYGLESFSDYCAAVKRVKEGLPPIEVVTPPDRNAPILIHGIQFKYWNPDEPESDASDTESELTALPTEDVENDRRKSTWSAGTPQRGILRQSTSSPLVRETELLPPEVAQTPLVDYASTASPASRRTSRHSSRRISIDAGVQSEHTEIQNDDEEIVRTAAKKRSSTRRSSIAHVRRGSFVHGLAGFTGIGRADSGAVICVANGKKFELVVDNYNRSDEHEVAVQCSALEIDSEIEALFGESHKDEVIDVDSLPENTQTGNQSNEEQALENNIENDSQPQTKKSEKPEEQDDVPSPEQLRSANPKLTTPGRNAVPDLSDIAATPMKEIGAATPHAVTPTHLSLKSDLQDKIHDEITDDEIVAVSAHGTNRLSIQPTASAQADVPMPPRETNGTQTESQLEAEAQEKGPNKDKPQENQSQPPGIAQTPDAPPAQPDIHCIADPTKTPPQATALAIARQRSLSFKPSSELVPIQQAGSDEAVQDLSLCLASVPGLDICPTASAYQLAAMATLSPKSYLRAIQPSLQPRTTFALATPGGTAPVRDINVAPPALLSTPPVATLAIAPSSSARASLIAAPRRSHVSIPRTELRTPSQCLHPTNGSCSEPTGDATTACVDLDGGALITPAPLHNIAHAPEPRPATSQGIQSAGREQSTSKGLSQSNIDESKVPSSTDLPQNLEEHPVDLMDDGDDDFGAPPDMDDDDVMDTRELDAVYEPLEKTDVAKIEAEQELRNPAEVESVKSKSRKMSMASSRTRTTRRTDRSSLSQQKRMSSVTQILNEPDELPNDADFAVDDGQESSEMADTESKEEQEVPKKKQSRKATSSRQAHKGGKKTTRQTGQKRWRELKSLSASQANVQEDLEEGGLRRSKRQRFPRLKFWKNETVSYERRLSQAIPTIAEVIVEVGDSESDDDTWFGRR